MKDKCLEFQYWSDNKNEADIDLSFKIAKIELKAEDIVYMFKAFARALGCSEKDLKDIFVGE